MEKKETQDEFRNEAKNIKNKIKPVISPLSPARDTLVAAAPSGPKKMKWSLGSLQDLNRKSAFMPYKSSLCTVLTNLQRGNTQAETPIPKSADINFHTRAGQGEIVQQDIDNESSIDCVDCNGLTALHWAAAYGQYNTVQLLLGNKAQVDKLGPEEQTPLILAANGGHHEVIRLLLNEGANVNHADHLCNTALMYAARGNHPHTCQELLLHGADFTLVNLNDDTAYSIAIDNNSSLAQAVITNFIISRLELTVDAS